MNTDTLHLARVRGATTLGRLRMGRDHHAAVARWRERNLVHYHITLRGVAVEDVHGLMTAVHANARVLASMLPCGSRMGGLVSGTVENGKLVAVWCVRAAPDLRLAPWAGFTVERQKDEEPG